MEGKGEFNADLTAISGTGRGGNLPINKECGEKFGVEQQRQLVGASWRGRHGECVAGPRQNRLVCGVQGDSIATSNSAPHRCGGLRLCQLLAGAVAEMAVARASRPPRSWWFPRDGGLFLLFTRAIQKYPSIFHPLCLLAMRVSEFAAGLQAGQVGCFYTQRCISRPLGYHNC